MMIVMKPTATEEQVQAVIARIESCGARAHPSRGEEVTVIGAIGDREHVARLGLEGHDGVAQVVPILKPFKLSSAQLRPASAPSSRSTGARSAATTSPSSPGPCTVESRDQVHDRRPRGRGRRREPVPRRRLQAALEPVLLPGPRAGGPAPARRGQGGDRAADRHRADGRARHRAGRRGRRRDPARRPQHAELRAAGRGRPRGPAGAAQARPQRHARGAADGGGVHPQGGQPERAAVRARHPHVRDGLPLHARPHRRAGAQGALAPAGDRRPEPRRRPPLAGGAAVASPRPRRAPTASSSRSTRSPTRRSATGRSSCAPTASPSTPSKVERAAAIAGKVLSNEPAA